MDYKAGSYDLSTLSAQLKGAFCERMQKGDVLGMMQALRFHVDFCYDMPELRKMVRELQMAYSDVTDNYWFNKIAQYVKESW